MLTGDAARGGGMVRSPSTTHYLSSPQPALPSLLPAFLSTYQPPAITFLLPLAALYHSHHACLTLLLYEPGGGSVRALAARVWRCGQATNMAANMVYVYDAWIMVFALVRVHISVGSDSVILILSFVDGDNGSVFCVNGVAQRACRLMLRGARSWHCSGGAGGTRRAAFNFLSLCLTCYWTDM